MIVRFERHVLSKLIRVVPFRMQVQVLEVAFDAEDAVERRLWGQLKWTPLSRQGSGDSYVATEVVSLLK